MQKEVLIRDQDSNPLSKPYDYPNTNYRNYEASNNNYNYQPNIYANKGPTKVVRKTYRKMYHKETNEPYYVEIENGCVSESADFKLNQPKNIESNYNSIVLDQKLENNLSESQDSNIQNGAKSDVYTAKSIYYQSNTNSHINYDSSQEEENKDLLEILSGESKFKKTQGNQLLDSDIDRNSMINYGGEHEKINQDLQEQFSKDSYENHSKSSKNLKQINLVKTEPADNYNKLNVNSERIVVRKQNVNTENKTQIINKQNFDNTSSNEPNPRITRTINYQYNPLMNPTQKKNPLMVGVRGSSLSINSSHRENTIKNTSTGANPTLTRTYQNTSNTINSFGTQDFSPITPIQNGKDFTQKRIPTLKKSETVYIENNKTGIHHNENNAMQKNNSVIITKIGMQDSSDKMPSQVVNETSNNDSKSNLQDFGMNSNKIFDNQEILKDSDIDHARGDMMFRQIMKSRANDEDFDFLTKSQLTNDQLTKIAQDLSTVQDNDYINKIEGILVENEKFKKLINNLQHTLIKEYSELNRIRNEVRHLKDMPLSEKTYHQLFTCQNKIRQVGHVLKKIEKAKKKQLERNMTLEQEVFMRDKVIKKIDEENKQKLEEIVKKFEESKENNIKFHEKDIQMAYNEQTINIDLEISEAIKSYNEENPKIQDSNKANLKKIKKLKKHQRSLEEQFKEKEMF